MGAYTIISFLGGFQGILLSTLFFTKGVKHPASRMLGWYILLFSAGLFETYLQSRDGMFIKIVLALLGFSNFLYGPLLYLFIVFLTSRNPHFKVGHLLHFLPFLAGFVTQLFVVLSAAAPKEDGMPELLIFEGLVFQLLTYNILAIKKLARHRRFVLESYSNLESQDFRWLRFLLILITAIYAISFSISHIIALGYPAARQWYIVVQILIMCTIYLLSYRVILQPGLFILYKNGKPHEKAAAGNGAYLKSGLKAEQAEEWLRVLVEYMETNKPYLDPDLSIYMLAGKLSISKNHLTEIINKRLKKNFFEFVNMYRVEEVKSLLENPRYSHLNLSTLGLKAGFKSKTAFNSNFKQITGNTPSDWKKMQSEQKGNGPAAAV